MRIGIFVCHCGSNIAGTVDVKKVAGSAREIQSVVFSFDYKYMCSEPGQAMIINTIKEKKLDRIVIAACSPKLHEQTFQKCLQNAGLNPYMVEMANIREHCSWVHPREERTTQKALDIVKIYTGKVSHNKPLHRLKVPMTKKALIIGGGIAGANAAMNISVAGYQVTLVEKENQLGGHLNNFKHTFPSLEKTEQLLENIQTLQSNPLVEIYTDAEVKEVGGYVGSFRAKIFSKKSNEMIEDVFGAIIVATGFDIAKQNGHNSSPDIINSLEFEQMLSNGKIIRPSDNKEVQNVVFVQCAGNGQSGSVEYCSKICCMYTAKQALLFTQKNQNNNAYIFHNDIVAAGKNHEEFIHSVRQQDHILYLKGNILNITANRHSLKVQGTDVLADVDVTIDADLVVLATSLVAREGASKVAQMVGIPYDKNNFYSELHAKLAPVDTVTTGIYLAGGCQSPKDIADTLASASAASSKVLSLFNHDHYEAEPFTASVNQQRCNGCFDCESVCTFNAIEKVTLKNGNTVARIIESMCQGCGNCLSACRPAAIDLAGFSNEQIISEIEYAAN